MLHVLLLCDLLATLAWCCAPQQIFWPISIHRIVQSVGISCVYYFYRYTNLAISVPHGGGLMKNRLPAWIWRSCILIIEQKYAAIGNTILRIHQVAWSLNHHRWWTPKRTSSVRVLSFNMVVTYLRQPAVGQAFHTQMVRTGTSVDR